MSTTLTELFGAKLLSGEGEVATASALSDKKAIAIYFSAHWCPPCRGFTPFLAKAYSDSLKAKGLEVIFVSSDRDEAAFKSYFAEQPWLALPFSDRKRKEKLSERYGVRGIPTLIILDAAGNIITKDGRSAVSEDPTGKAFPWTPPSVWDALGEEFLQGSEGATVEVDALQKAGGVLGLYFSAHWCPPCRGFTPKLVETYTALRKANQPFEVIFVSSDRTAEEFREYYATMPWLAIPAGDPRKAALSRLFDVEGIPTLVLLDATTGEVLSTDGRSTVMSDPKGKRFPWGASTGGAKQAGGEEEEPKRRSSVFSRMFSRRSSSGAPAAAGA